VSNYEKNPIRWRGRSRRFQLFLGIFTVIVVVIGYFGYPLILGGIGSYLIVENPLERASAIVVLGGHLPFRAMEGARIYRNGWAPKVVLTRNTRREEFYALRSLGIETTQEFEVNREVLLRLHVPEDAIVMLDQEVENTIAELKLVLHALSPTSGNPVILVTSKLHSRRTVSIWNYLTGGQVKGILRVARDDPLNVDQWWKERRFALSVVREYLGLANYWMGFPMG